MKYARQKGFSILEVAVVTAAAATMFAMLPGIMSNLAAVQTSATAFDAASDAKAALYGFVYRSNRLPCPDADGDGLEDCAGSNRVGMFPYRTVGLPQPLRNSAGFDYRYGVYRGAAGGDADLAAATETFTPRYYGDGANYWSASSELTSVNTNAFDFCEKLRRAHRGGLDAAQVRVQSLANASQHVNVAFMLADPGAANADLDAGADNFDGVNHTGLVFESPMRPRSADYDDKVTVQGFNQMSAELQCPILIAGLSAAAREADFAQDDYRAARMFRDIRAYQKDLRSAQVDMAALRQDMAAFSMAMTVAMTTTDLAIGLSSASGAISVAVAIINATIAITMATKESDDAADGKAGADADYATAVTQLANADAWVTQKAAMRTARRNAVVAIDAKGWFQ